MQIAIKNDYFLLICTWCFKKLLNSCEKKKNLLCHGEVVQNWRTFLPKNIKKFDCKKND